MQNNRAHRDRVGCSNKPNNSYVPVLFDVDRTIAVIASTRVAVRLIVVVVLAVPISSSHSSVIIFDGLVFDCGRVARFLWGRSRLLSLDDGLWVRLGRRGGWCGLRLVIVARERVNWDAPGNRVIRRRSSQVVEDIFVKFVGHGWQLWLLCCWGGFVVKKRPCGGKRKLAPGSRGSCQCRG